MSILDLGTGSGCLLLTLLKLFPKSFGLGVDIQAGALAVARQNASKFALKERVNFSKKDWKNMRLQAEFDLIVCNPPYIRTCDIPDLALDVKEYEPDCALDGGYDGLRCYSTLMPMIRKLLKPEGVSVLECGYGQLADIRAIAHKNGLSLTKYMKDYSGNTRAIALRKVCR
jgi:release factor glutamine methyltransferase